MGLPTNLSFLRTGTGGQTLEVYLEPLCPFSYKMARSLEDNVLPHVKEGGKYHGKVELIIRVYAQPFHYFSAFPCEAILVFCNEHPDLFWEYFMASFAIQDNWFNKMVKDKTPLQCQQAYVDVALDVLEKHGRLPAGPRSKAAGAMMDKLQVQDKMNGGSTMFTEIKYLTREGRQNGIHFTPTVLLNGLEDGSVSSSFGKDDWDKYLAEKIQ
ncbi:hypothetical protein CcaverHIS631_0112270 [Cutaneotrichosporon cavernicola]|nr:hypothetical protein CcaverHIS631_0112270 [Cutaneotrichosporon cavernicola]BEJ04050.1 hypothetical protein CcaverHIS641_0112250 [Cutaneotrichosporon cavernicola]